MREELKAILIGAVLVIFIVGVVFIRIQVIQDIEGEIIDKYRNGQANTVFHFVIQKEADKKEPQLLDVTVKKDIFDSYNVGDVVRLQYNIILKNVININMANR